ncbi:hypothetical protein [Spirosoma litoris]
MGFLLANWRYFVGILLTIGFGVICYTCQNRGDTVDTLKTTVTSLKVAINAKDDTLAVERARVSRLKTDTARLNTTVDKYGLVILQQQAQLEAGEKAALLADQAIQAGKANVNRIVDSWNKFQKKQAADAGLASENLSYYGPGLSVEDTATTTRIAKLTGYGQVYHDSTQALKRLTGQQRERIEQLTTKNSNLAAQNSELEQILNNVRSDVQGDFVESQQEKHPFGFGQKASKERLRKKVIARLPVKTSY